MVFFRTPRGGAAPWLVAATLLVACASPDPRTTAERAVPQDDGDAAEAVLARYVAALEAGDAPDGAVLDDLVVTELSSIDGEGREVATVARGAAQAQAETARAEAEAGQPRRALARTELAVALIRSGCGECGRQRLAYLRQFAGICQALPAQDAAELGCRGWFGRVAERTLRAGEVAHWNAIEQTADLQLRLGDPERAAASLRRLIDARTYVLGADHPSVLELKARAARIEQTLGRSAPAPVSAAPREAPRD